MMTTAALLSRETSINPVHRELKKGKVVMTYPVCYDEDIDGFITRLMKNHFEGRIYSSEEFAEIQSDTAAYSACIEGYTTYSQRYSIADFRLIIETRGNVLDRYNLKFINDQVIVTMKTVTYIYNT